MSSNETDKTPETPQERSGNSHAALIGVLAVGLIAALAGDGYLLMRSNQTNEDMAQMKDGTQTQISKLGEATTSLLEQRMQALNEELKTAQDDAATAIKRARSETQKQAKELRGTLEEQQEQQKQVVDQVTQLKDSAASSDSKIAEVSSDVNGVKTDVSAVKTDVASTQSDLNKTGADLKRVMGDMGVMSGLIATNSRDLDALRALGERNYFEFDLTKAQGMKKIGDVVLTLKKADPKRNRFTVDVLADDKHVEKKDKTMNEPVQLYLSGNMQPYEIVINQVKKDEVVGYLATPKVKVARR